MSQQKLVYDGLWRCLCPSIDRHSLFNVVNSGALPRSIRQGSQPVRTAAVATRQRRQFTSSALRKFDKPPHPYKRYLSRDLPADDVAAHLPLEESLLGVVPPTEELLRMTSPDDIRSALLVLRRGWRVQGRGIEVHSRIVQLVTHLIRAREQPLKPFFYECMMDAMVDPEGSAQGVRRLFRDMNAQGMQPTMAMCQSALEALMIHPDYNLRQEVLAIMRSLWFPVGTTGEQKVVVGLLRDGQYELAYDTLSSMVAAGTRIDAWVYDIFIMVYGNMGFVEEILPLLHQRKTLGGSKDDFLSILYFVLDVCSQNFNHAGTTYAWDELVRRLRVPPPDGLVENVLATAAKHGDTDLAIEALDVLSQRGRFQAHHYEAAADAFCNNEVLAGALGILDVMTQNGVVLSSRNTRMLYLMLKKNPDLMDGAVSLLEKLQWKRPIPPAIVASIVEAIAELRGSEATLEICSVLEACSGLEETDGKKANPTMLRHLICNSQTPELRRSLFAAYKQSLVDQDDPGMTLEAYNKLIPVCVEAGEWDLAMELATRASEPTNISMKWHDIAWFGPLLKDAVAREDTRIMQVIDKLATRVDEAAAKKIQSMVRARRPLDTSRFELEGRMQASESSLAG